MTHRSNGPLAWSVVAISLTLGVVLLNFPAVARAALRPRASAREDLLAEATAMLDKYAEAESTYIARFKGRSAFFEPPQPPVSESPIVIPPTPEPAPEPRSEPEPRRRPDYKAIGGRPLTRLHGDLAVFDDGTRLHVGEQKNDLMLLEVHAPWSARVRLRDWEYDVELFARSHGEAFFAREDQVNEPPAEQVALTPIETPVTATPNVLVDDDLPAEDPAGPIARAYRGRVPELLDAAQVRSMTHQELIGYASELSTARRSWAHNARTPEDRRTLERMDQAWQAATARLLQLRREAGTSREAAAD